MSVQESIPNATQYVNSAFITVFLFISVNTLNG